MYGRGYARSVRDGQTYHHWNAPRHVIGTAPNTAARKRSLALSVGWLCLVSACAVPSRGKPAYDDDRQFMAAAARYMSSEPPTQVTRTRPHSQNEPRPIARGMVRQADFESTDAQPLRPVPHIAFAAGRDRGGVVLASATQPTLAPVVVGPQVESNFALVTDSETPWAMTVDDVLAFTAENHPLLHARQHEIEAARARLIAAGRHGNPQFVMDTEAPVNTSRRSELSMRLVFPFPTAGKVQRREEVALAGIRRSQMALSRETESVLLAAADAAIQVLYLQELERLNEELRELAVERAASIQPDLKNGAGEVNLVDRVEADIDAVQAQTRLLNTKASLATARVRLARAMGQTSDAPIVIHGTLDVALEPLLPLDTVLMQARINNPRLDEACATLNESQRQHMLARSEAVPDFEFGPRYQDRLGVEDDMIGARFNTNVPLFDRNEGAILETAATIRSNRALVRVAELNSLSDVISAYRELESIRDRIEYYQSEANEMVQRNRRLVEDPDTRRLMTTAQFLEIRQDLAVLERERMELRFRYHQLMAQLEILVGERIATSQDGPGSEAVDG